MREIKRINNQLIEKFLDEWKEAVITTNFELLKDKITSFSYANIQLLIDSLPDYILLVDSEHKIIMANKALERLGFSPEEILGKYCPEVIHNSTSPIPECPLEEAVECNCSVEREIYDKENQRWFLSVAYQTPFWSMDGKEIYFHQLKEITESKKYKLELKRTLDRINKILEQGIQAIVKLVEKRDPYTAGHQKNVSFIAREIAIEMGLSEDIVETVAIAGLLHDIGKIIVPLDILNKPTKLNEHEFNLIKLHSIEGYNILKDIDFPWSVAKTVLQHHERLNGSGYPNHLQSSEISLPGKILGVADVVDAMSSHRPYRPALGTEVALDELENNKGILYDPDIVEACIKLFRSKKINIY